MSILNVLTAGMIAAKSPTKVAQQTSAISEGRSDISLMSYLNLSATKVARVNNPVRLMINPSTTPPILSSPPSSNINLNRVLGDPPIVRMSASSYFRDCIFSNTEINMLAKLKAIINNAIALKAFVPMPN